jgi:hypothetical protein
MRHSGLKVLSVFAVSLFFVAGPLVSPAGAIDAKVDSLIRKSCNTLAEANALTFSADISFEEMSESGERTAHKGRVETAIKRPDGVQTVYRGEGSDRSFWYDGEKVTVMSPGSGFYATEKAPGGMDDALDFVNTRLGFSLPLEDFYYSDPYSGLLAGVTEGSYVGKEAIGGVPCHRLALVQEDIDWEIWIEDSDRPVPRKLSITYKNLPGKPRYSATISDWNFSPDLSRRFFIFEPPLGSERIGVLPPVTETPAEGGGKR